jgi:4-amino-4-deoxy-L-arabinose transferase-like glycosyltransferase
MFNFLGSLQGLIGLVFGIFALVLAVYGLVDALRNRPDAFTAAGKASKNIWLAILGVAVALAFYSITSPFSLAWILAVVGAGVYAADVRPALRQVMGRGSGSSR